MVSNNFISANFKNKRCINYINICYKECQLISYKKSQSNLCIFYLKMGNTRLLEIIYRYMYIFLSRLKKILMQNVFFSILI